MKLFYFLLALILTSCVYEIPDDDIDIAGKKVSLILDENQALKLAGLPFKCIDQEYPNKLNQVLADEGELMSPRLLHPAFYGCFDWHSSVHGHWLLVRLMKEFPNMEQDSLRFMLSKQLSKENIAGELNYFNMEFNGSFERTYGWAWLLKLQNELLTWDDTLGVKLSANLQPLAELIGAKYMEFLPKLSHPLRSGEHPNSAFGLSFAFDYSVTTGNDSLRLIIIERAKFYFSKDEDANLAFEPSGYDFLSPTLEEIRLMKKILSKKDFLTWLSRFMPGLLNTNFNLNPELVTDRTDGKLVHLDGLNLSRAWCLYDIAKSDKRLKHLRIVADKHLQAALPTIFDGHYSGEHWLASFAVFALLQRKVN
ncbi:MAG: hypothetical protein ACI9G9_000092 [Psychromonas sp.]|jgi:hypothetical protein